MGWPLRPHDARIAGAAPRSEDADLEAQLAAHKDVRWFSNGIDTHVTRGPGKTDVLVSDNSNVHFAMLNSTAGAGMAQIYWNRPANDTSDSGSDSSLAQTLLFTIEQPTPTPTV
jgi:hypothetical protein